MIAQQPLIVKPYQGHRGAGVHVVRSVADLAAVVRAGATPDGTVVVQEFVPGPGEDFKLYIVGDYVFAVRKPFSITSFAVAGEPVAVSRDVRDLALRCGEALGLGLYGIDVIESPTGPSWST